MEGVTYLSYSKFNYPALCYLASCTLTFLALFFPLIAIIRGDLPFVTYSAKDLYDLGIPLILYSLIASSLISFAVFYVMYHVQYQSYRTWANYSMILKVVVDLYAIYLIFDAIEKLNNNQLDETIIVFQRIFTLGTGGYFIFSSVFLAIVGMYLEYSYNKAVGSKVNRVSS